MKRPLPETACTACGNAGYNLNLVNGRCAKQVRGERCKGTNSSAINDGDWHECTSCHGIGVERNAQCSKCRGVGWQFVRSLTASIR
jgi:DnaJ-class molecular chaperone